MKVLSAFLIILFQFTGQAHTIDTLKINDFNSLKVNGKINVELHQGEPLIILKSKFDFDLEDLEMKVKGKELRLSVIKAEYKDKEPTLHIYCKNFEFLKATGSASITSKHNWAIKELNLDVQAGGHIGLKSTCSLMEASVSQGGTITLSGTATLAILKVNTGGTIGAKNFEAKNGQAKVNAGGEIYVYAIESLTATVKAGGTINYKGEPQVLNKVTKLGGKIQPMKAAETHH